MDLQEIKRRHNTDWQSLQAMHGTQGAQRECTTLLRDRGQLIAEVDRLTALCEEQGREIERLKLPFNDICEANGKALRTAESVLSQAREDVKEYKERWGFWQDRAEAAEQREKVLREAVRVALIGFNEIAGNASEGFSVRGKGEAYYEDVAALAAASEVKNGE